MLGDAHISLIRALLLSECLSERTRDLTLIQFIFNWAIHCNKMSQNQVTALQVLVLYMHDRIAAFDKSTIIPVKLGRSIAIGIQCLVLLPSQIQRDTLAFEMLLYIGQQHL